MTSGRWRRPASAGCGPSRCSRHRTCSRPSGSQPSTWRATTGPTGPTGPTGAGRGADGRLRDPHHCYVCKEQFIAAPPLLRPAVPVVRGVQLRQAHGDRRPAWPRGAGDREAGSRSATRRGSSCSAPVRRSSSPRASRATPRCATHRSPTSTTGPTGSRSSGSTSATRRASRRCAATSTRPVTASTSWSTTRARPCGARPRSTST